jgi:hypothetical protein
MNNPMKIIFKYKNSNRRVQYHMYIFIGPVTSSISNILNKIKTLSLYETLMELSSTEYTKLEKYYGDKWYNFFFNTYHLNYLFYHINNNKHQKKEIINKYGDEWYDKHFKQYLVVDKKVFYSYAANIKNIRTLKEHKKLRKNVNDTEDNDYKTNKNILIDTNMNKKAHGGGDNIIDDSYYFKNNDILNAMHVFHKNIDVIKNDNISGGYNHNKEDKEDTDVKDDTHNTDATEEEYVYNTPDEDDTKKFDEMVEDNIENIYQDNDAYIDENIKNTSKLINDALKNDDIFKKINKNLFKFDTSKDKSTIDEELKNVYYKHYITTQFIFKDDTIKTIKSKICCTISNNDEFGKKPYIIPSRQHLWCEYLYESKIEKVMIGQKWIRRTELINIDVEPNNNFAVYEELRGKLRLLRDNLKRFGSKIKREDDDYNIIYDYENYYTNNEIYMCDIYNELGKGYNPDGETLKNLMDVYIKIYFPRIKQDDIKYIIDYLNDDTIVEENKISSIYDTLYNDLLLENQIMFNVEKVKETSLYKDTFSENYITNSAIHINLRTINTKRIDLFRIFNEFVTSDSYPFVQYQSPDGQIVYKFNEKVMSDYVDKNDNTNILLNWFENAPYGISFKVKIHEMSAYKFMAINLNDIGRMEYKTQWKENDLATTKDIINTYDYVRKLIKKINNENNKVEFEIPNDIEFKYAFINSIQKFSLPDKYAINHNDLSEFARYFFPYISLVIEPRKRQSKIKQEVEKSKFGTYLRYKRVTKYENQARIEQRILYFIKNYDYNDKSLANEISKQFNITMDRSMEEIDRVREKYPNIKRSRKILKKLENIPKYKPPGIGIDIQGKPREKYKIRISGARDKEQMDRILNFMNIFIHLYIETYLLKLPERQHLKDKLLKLTNIAKRRNKVDELVNYEKEELSVKQMAKRDKTRLGFKPSKGQNQWTRLCQHSGKDKKRRPQQYLSENDVLKNGFIMNDKTGMYEKKVTYSTKKGKSNTVTIRAVGLKNSDQSAELDSTIFYSCNPIDNGQHMYIGFLSRSTNPFGACMPCCFKKDHYFSENTEKKEYFKDCVANIQKPKTTDTNKIVGDVLYILQDTNKVQEGRFSFLQKYLNYFFNEHFGNTLKIKQHHLIESKTGYYFKYGINQSGSPFFNAISALLDKSVSNLKSNIIKVLENDKKDLIFTSLNNGDIRTQFETKDKFINFIKNDEHMEFNFYADILALPESVTKKGLNIIVFNKQIISIKMNLEKDKTIDDFLIMCQNPENLEELFVHDTIFLVRENFNYFPIVLVHKKDSNNKDVTIKKIFTHNKDEIVNHVKDLYIRNCNENVIYNPSQIYNSIIAKKLYNILLELNNKEFMPKYQFTDTRNKCKYIICKNNTIIPVKPSGTIHHLKILNNIYNNTLSIKETIDNINKLRDLIKNKENILIKPIGFYYETKTKNDAEIIAIMTETRDSIPVKEEKMSINEIKKMKFILEHKQLYDEIDKDIIKNMSNKIAKDDIREYNVNLMKYNDESYELFRLEFSEYINHTDNLKIKTKITKLLAKNDISNIIKKDTIKLFLFGIIDNSLEELFRETISDITPIKGKNKLIYVDDKYPTINNYQINNNRNTCPVHESKDKCFDNIHCKWSNDKCKLRMTTEIAIMSANKLSDELVNDVLKANELLQIGEYYVSDIVDNKRFTEMDGQKIIKSTSMTLDKNLKELFENSTIPIIGKRRIQKISNVNVEQLNADMPMKNMGNYYTQQIISNNLTLYRAFINGYLWVKQKYYDIQTRNIGYYSELQTHLANYIKSLLIDYVIDKNNKVYVSDLLNKYYDKNSSINNFINKINKDITTTTNCIVELAVLSIIYNVIVIVYNDNMNIIYVFDRETLFINTNDNSHNKKIEKYKNIDIMKKSINIKFSVVNSLNYPTSIETIYYA